MKPDSMDEMIRNYFSREEEPFTYKEREKHSLRVPALITALLLLVGIMTLSLLTESKDNKVNTPKALENSVSITASTAVMERPLSASPGSSSTESVGDSKQSEARKIGVFVIDGENLYGLKSRSLYQDATFFRIRNSDLKQNWRLEWDAYIDLNGEKNNHENIIHSSDTFANVDENGYYKWIISEETANRIALAYAPEKNLRDVVETIIYFNDGSFVRKVYDINYEGGAMMIYENVTTIEGYDAP